MDEEYDAILLGTGMSECVLSGLLSVSGKKVLHIDKNDYYGGELASLSLQQLFDKFDKKIDEKYGPSKDWNVDLCLKLIMAHSDLVGMFVSTGVTRYIELKQVGGSYVMQGSSLYKVPITEYEVLKSGTLGIMQKKRMYSLVSDANKCDFSKNQVPSYFKPETPMLEVFERYKLSPETRHLVGHVIALYQTDDFLNGPCIDTYKRMENYSLSLSRFGKSPYIYPMYGLGEIPQAFARLSAVYGGTYMLKTPVDEIIKDENGVFVGIKSGEHVIKSKMVIGDPSYFPDMVKKVGAIVRCICILDHPINSIGDVDSCQIIIPGHQVKRVSDIYIGVVSKANASCPSGFYVAVVTANVEHPEDPEIDVKPGLSVLGNICEKFMFTSDVFHPINDGTENKVCCFLFLIDS